MLRKDSNGTSMVAIAKHPAIHTKAMPKYVAPNLRGPKLIWVPSKSGWIFVGTIGIGDLVQLVFILLITWLSQVLKRNDHYPNAMTSEWSPMCYNIQVQRSSCDGDWIYLMACIYMSWSLLIAWSWANQGISLVDHFIWVHMSCWIG